MIVLWIVLGAVLSLVLLCIVYWLLLCSMYREKIQTEEVYMVATQDLWKIRVCRYRRGRTQGEPILLCHGAGANHHNFTYPEAFSLIDYLVELGYDCWAVDLRGCRSSQPPFGRKHFEARLDDYLLKDIPAVMDQIRRVTGYERVHWVGHSLGGFLLYAYVLEYGDKHIASGISIAAPIGFDGTRVWSPQFAVRFLARHPGLASRAARAYVPIGKALHLPMGLFPVNLRNVHPRVTAEHMFIMLDNLLPDIFGSLADWARNKAMHLKNGSLNVKEGLSTLRLPIMCLFAPSDPFISPEYAWRFFDQLPSQDKEMLVLSKEDGCVEDYNHVEIPFSREVRKEVFMPIGRWLASHPAPRPAAGDRKVPGVPAQGHGTSTPHHERHGILSGSSFEHVVGRNEEPDEDGGGGAEAAHREVDT